MNNNKNNIPRCQQIQNEYKTNFSFLRETIAEINNGNTISIEDFKHCMAFVYREGWGDCFNWDGEISGEETRKEFFNILDIDVMKTLSDGINVTARSYYYLLDWNESNKWEIMLKFFGKSRLADLNIFEYKKLFEYATQSECNELS